MDSMSPNSCVLQGIEFSENGVFASQYLQELRTFEFTTHKIQKIQKHESQAENISLVCFAANGVGDPYF